MARYLNKNRWKLRTDINTLIARAKNAFRKMTKILSNILKNLITYTT